MGRCPHSASAHEALSGRDQDGEFRTARGKTYPVGLNRVLADAVIAYVQQTFSPSSGQSLPADFQDLVATNFVSDNVVQPDFY